MSENDQDGNPGRGAPDDGCGLPTRLLGRREGPAAPATLPAGSSECKARSSNARQPPHPANRRRCRLPPLPPAFD